MRHHATATAIAAGLLLASLTACGGSDDDKATNKPTPKPSATIDQAAQYLSTAREITFNGNPTDAELKALPPQWCDALGDGHSTQWLLGDGDLYPIGETWGTVKDDAYKLIVAGVRAYCPTHLSAVQSELRDAGAY
jgi:hypothetical protein